MPLPVADTSQLYTAACQLSSYARHRTKQHNRSEEFANHQSLYTDAKEHRLRILYAVTPSTLPYWPIFIEPSTSREE